jgi:hypothetical protein
MRWTRLAPALVLLAVLTGCGTRFRIESSGPPGPVYPLFSLAGMRKCLVAHGVRLGGRPDAVASSATGGAFVAHLDGNEVTVSVGQTIPQGVGLETAYRRFSQGDLRSSLGTVLRRYDNVVTLWHVAPAAAPLSRLVGCLRA